MPEIIEQPSTEQLQACPLCGEESWTVLPTPGDWIGPEVFEGLEGRIGLVQCRACGLVFINPRPSGEKLTAFYSGDTYCCHETAGSASAGAKADYILNRLEKSLPAEAPRTLLDYGAGGGGFLLHAQSRGWNVQGFEPGKRGLESCRALGLDATDRLEDLPEGTFGLVTLHHVFEHLPNPAEVLETAGWSVEATLTLGLGLDEFFVPQSSAPKQNHHAKVDAKSPASSPQKRRFRHQLREAFLGLGWGENLAAIGFPASRSSKTSDIKSESAASRRRLPGRHRAGGSSPRR